MAQEKFELITERPVARIPASLSRRWERLAARQERLQKEAEKLQADMDACEERLVGIVPGLDEDAHDGFRLDDDNMLYQVFCRCIECQAKLHGMSVVDTAEAMIRAGLVKKAAIAETREHALTCDGVTGAVPRVWLN